MNLGAKNRIKYKLETQNSCFGDPKWVPTASMLRNTALEVHNFFSILLGLKSKKFPSRMKNEFLCVREWWCTLLPTDMGHTLDCDRIGRRSSWVRVPVCSTRTFRDQRICHFPRRRARCLQVHVEVQQMTWKVWSETYSPDSNMFRSQS